MSGKLVAETTLLAAVKVLLFEGGRLALLTGEMASGDAVERVLDAIDSDLQADGEMYFVTLHIPRERLQRMYSQERGFDEDALKRFVEEHMSLIVHESE